MILTITHIVITQTIQEMFEVDGKKYPIYENSDDQSTCYMMTVNTIIQTVQNILEIRQNFLLNSQLKGLQRLQATINYPQTNRLSQSCY